MTQKVITDKKDRERDSSKKSLQIKISNKISKKNSRKKSTKLSNNQGDTTHMKFYRIQGHHFRPFFAHDESFLVILLVSFVRHFECNQMSPVSQSALRKEMSPTVEGPAHDLLKQGRTSPADVPLVPQVDSFVGQLDNACLSSLTFPPVQP